MPPLIRRRPLLERIKAHLDPYDLYLWLSEELNETYEEVLNTWATSIGIAGNILFILARGASRAGASKDQEDVFGYANGSKTGWLSWLAASLVHILAFLCCFNAFMTFFRKRHYRLFEQPIDAAPATPSARRVHVDSSPGSSSPMSYLQNVLSQTTAAARAHPDATREVWEISVWDPKPFSLTIFTLFSPGHLLVYYTLLPPASSNSRPSVTIVTAMLFGVLLTVQLSLLKTSFSQQAKDSSLIHGEVMSEYDTKFVHPALHRPVRDVGIQTRESAMTPRGTRTREVDVYTPTTIINRGFKTNPNPNYAGQYDPHDLSSKPEPRRQSGVGLPRSVTTPALKTPGATYMDNTTQSSAYPPSANGAADFSSPIKPHHERLREQAPARGDGGSMGVYSHAASPLKKATSSGFLRAHAAERRDPTKRTYSPGGSGTDGVNEGRRRQTGRF